MKGPVVSIGVKRPILGRGLWVAVGRPGAMVWTYVLNLGIALLFTLPLHARLASLMDQSMGAERLSSAFDLGTAAAGLIRLNYRAPSAGSTPYLGILPYVLGYFLLAPGALVCFRLKTRARLGTMLSEGLRFFWRFVRITLLMAIVSGVVLVPLSLLQGAWGDHVTEHVVGEGATFLRLPGVLVIVLVAALLRLYFDLVEVYTVQLDAHVRESGKPDRRVRKTLIPAWKTMWRNLGRAWGGFVLIGALSALVVVFTGRWAMLTLAQPRVWPAFLLLQIGVFVSVVTRFWQRGMETVLAGDNPLVVPMVVEPEYPYVGERTIVDPAAVEPVAMRTAETVPEPVVDPLPDPEPAVPSEDLEPGLHHRPPSDLEAD